jgi:hypothetical protein
MAKFLIEIPDAQAVELMAAFADYYGYQPTVTNEAGETVANPMTLNSFWTSQTAKFWNDIATAYRNKKAVEVAPTVEAFQVDLKAEPA